MSDLVATARAYTAAGLLVLPCAPAKKHPQGQWGHYTGPHNQDSIQSIFGKSDRICIITGSKSGGVEVIDFDQQGLQWGPWAALVHEAAPGLLEKLVIERSPSGGFHAFYLSEVIEGNQKLALDQYQRVTIETRGEGGLIVCAPTPGYEITNGALTAIPVITADERDTLLSCARMLNEYHEPETKPQYHSPAECKGTRPGDLFEAEGDAPGLLTDAGWQYIRTIGENMHFCRPGKTNETKATYHIQKRKFYCFTSNGHPFEPSKSYSPFAVLAFLRFNGDFVAAAKDLAAKGWGVPAIPAQPSPTSQIIEEDEITPEVVESETFSWGHAVRYDTKNDANRLLGHRWLSKGGSCVWVGTTGMGKSSLIAQAAAVWSLNQPFFGIVPARALRSLIVQAENDEGDIGEITCGITDGLELRHRLDELAANIHFAKDTAIAGDAFIGYLRRKIALTKPDLVWIDPLFSFCGCDVSDQGAMSKFLRLGLQKIAQDTGVCMMVVHHTNKPRQKEGNQPTDEAYSGSGTAEIANWSRAVVRVRKNTATGDYELIAAKRGRRAGLLTPDGRHAESVFLKHAPFPAIYWLPAIEPENRKAAAEKERAQEIVQTLKIGEYHRKTELKSIVAAALGKDLNAVGVPDRPPWRIWQMVEQACLDPKNMNYYSRKV